MLPPRRIEVNARASRGRAAVTVFVLAGALICAWVAACTTAAVAPATLTTRVQVLDAPVDPAVYRVTVRWQGDAPDDREALLLERCARVAEAAGGRTFYVVNASERLAHPEWLVEGGVDSPTLIVPESEIAGGGALSALIRVFGRERAPEGFRLYDVQRVLHGSRHGSA
jgi:hypothetical protein